MKISQLRVRDTSHLRIGLIDGLGLAFTPDRFSVVVVVPESIYRAVLRVVYRFRAPPLRTVTTPDLVGAAGAVRAELDRMRRPIDPEIERFLGALTA